MKTPRFFKSLLLFLFITIEISAQSAGFSANRTEICRNEVIEFTAGFQGADKYEWIFGEGAVPALADGEGPFQVYYNTPGVKTVKLVVNDTIENTRSDYLEVFSEPTVFSDIKSLICSGDSFVIDPGDNITNSISGVFNWTASYPAGLIGGPVSGTGMINGSITNLLSSELEAIFSIIPVSDAGCIGSPFNITVPVSPVPTVHVSPSQQKVCTGLPIRDIEFINTRGISGVSYSWVRDKSAIITGIPDSGMNEITGILHSVSAIPEIVTFTITPAGPSGCSGPEAVTTVLVNPSPQISFTVRSTFNITEDPYNLSGSPSGGTFSGPGVVSHENRFYPSIAGLGSMTIMYSYQDQEGCVSSVSQEVEVFSAEAYIEGFPETGIVCYDEGNILLTGSSLIGLPGGYFTGRGITNTEPDKSIFNPVEAGSGTHIISYFYYDFAETLFEYSKEIFVDSTGNVDFINLTDGSAYCENSPQIELIVTPFGGAFTPIPGLVNNIFTPANSNKGLIEIRYTYTSESGCSKQAFRTIVVNEIPLVDFTMDNTCITLSDPDSIRFINQSSTLNDPVVQWHWNFGNSMATEEENNSELYSPGHLYRTPGLRDVRLSATTINGCTSVITKQVEIGDNPRGNFTWDSECFTPGNAVSFFNASESISPLVDYNWTFYDKDGTGILNTSYGTNTQFIFPELAYYDVELALRNQLNCTGTIKKTIYLRPSISLSEGLYEADFNEGHVGWIPETGAGTSVNSWVFGSTQGTVYSKPDENQNAWHTRIANSGAAEQSSVLSPCFDFRDVSRPMIQLNLWRHFERNRDGGALQYSIDNAISWQNVGTIGAGINWYNSFQIAGNPGGQPVGWTAQASGVHDSGWVESTHDLDFLKGQPDVRFRLAYGTNGTGLNNKGFAFRNIRIKERSRTVLLEHFTNSYVPANEVASNIIGSVVQSKPDDISVLNYHTAFQGADPLNKHNQADPAARALFYGVSATPYSIMDGGLAGKGRYDFVLSEVNESDLTLRSFDEPAFKLKLEQETINGKVKVKVELNALKDIVNKELTLHAAIIETEIAASLAGLGSDIVFPNVVKKLLPDASGTRLPISWSANDTASFHFAWDMVNVFDIEKIGVVVFIQDEKTKEIYQSAKNMEYTAPIGIEPGIEPGGHGNVSVFPNPARDHLFIRFDHVLTADAKLEVYTLTGRVLISEFLKAGSSLYYFDAGILDKGVYVYTIRWGNNTPEGGRVVILK